MARGRMLNTSISVSEKMAELGDTKHIVVMTWTLAHLDKNGVFYASARKIKGAVVPMLDEISAEDCQAAIEAAERVGLIKTFEHEGQLYQVWPGFLDNQRGLHVERERTMLPEFSGNCRQLPATSGKLWTKGIEENRTEGKGTEAGSAHARTATATPPPATTPPPTTSQPVEHTKTAATATPVIPDAMRTQKAPPRAKPAHWEWPKVRAFRAGMAFNAISVEHATLIEETCIDVTPEVVERRAAEWLTRYGKPIRDETWAKAIEVCANGWAERKAVSVPAPPMGRKGARQQVTYTDESRAAAEERARQQLAERESRRAGAAT